MKICFVIGSLNYSGAEKIMTNLIFQFEEKNYDTTVLLIGEEKKSNKFKHTKEVPLLTYKHGNKLMNIFNRLSKLRNELKKEFDVILCFGVIYNIDVLLASIGLDKKIIICERNDPINDPRNKLKRILRKILYPRASGYVFQTDEIANFFSNKINKNSIIIPNFVENNANKYKEERDTSFVVCSRIDNNQKDFRSLIETYKLYIEHGGTYSLNIYGTGPDFAYVNELISRYKLNNKVYMHGRISDVTDTITKHGIYILNSNYEGMPNSLLEALSCGMPCIATDCSGGGSKSLVKDGYNGILVKRKNVNELYYAMKRLSEDSSLREKISKNALMINESHSIDRIFNIWEGYILKVSNTD